MLPPLIIHAIFLFFMFNFFNAAKGKIPEVVIRGTTLLCGKTASLTVNTGRCSASTLTISARELRS